jgi:K+-transporting ATPase ATPase A chain
VDFYSIVQYGLFLVIVTVMVKPLGGYMERVFSGKTTILDWFCVPIERLIYRVSAIDPKVEMTAPQYAISFVLFSVAGTLLLFCVLRLQGLSALVFP